MTTMNGRHAPAAEATGGCVEAGAKRLTPRQADCLRAIYRMTLQDGCAPCVAALATATGVSYKTAWGRAEALQAAGRLVRGHSQYLPGGMIGLPLLLSGVRYQTFADRLVPVIDHETCEGLALLDVISPPVPAVTRWARWAGGAA